MPSDTVSAPGRLIPLVDRFGWLPIALAVLTVLTLVAQSIFGPHVPYTWLDPIGLYVRVLIQPGSITIIALSWFAGRAVRLSSYKAALHEVGGKLREAFSPTPNLFIPGIAALNTVLLGLLLPEITAFDLLAGFLALWLFVEEAPKFLESQNRGRVYDGLLTVGILIFVSYVHTWLKAMVFVWQPAMDAQLLHFEQSVYGFQPHALAARWGSEHPGVVYWLDYTYFSTLQHISAVAAFLTGLNLTAVRHRYIASLAIVYVLGGLTYHIYPLIGPVYADPEAFTFLRSQTLTAPWAQQHLLDQTTSIRTGGDLSLTTYAYIAAMPSLHLAHESVMLAYSRFSRLFFAWSALFYAVTVVAVLVLGWHYVEDMVFGVLLSVVAIAIAERVGERWMPAAIRQPPSTPPTPRNPAPI